MQNKNISLFLIILAAVLGIGAIAAIALMLGVGSLFVITKSSGEPPTPFVEIQPEALYQSVKVDQVEVEVGVGSPIPVNVVVSGNLPDTCAQLEYSEVKQAGTNFVVKLSSIPSKAEGCIQDTLPFKIRIPLNVVGMPAGTYSVDVNGSHADFKLDTNNTTATLPKADLPFAKHGIQVDDVQIETGVGSPIPVKAIVSASLPSACAQLGEIRLHRDGNNFFVRLVAYVPEQTDCNPDTLPLRVEVPLNIVNLPEGNYAVNINGASKLLVIPVQ